MPCVSRKRDTSVSGGRAISFSNVSTVHDTSPFGGPLRGAPLPARRLGLPLGLPLLDDVLGRLRDDAPLRVEALASGAAGDLLEVADREEPDLRAVELRELREEDGADRDVHADAERVGPADDVEEPLLRELLDEQPVLREEPGVVDADAEGEEAAELLAVRASRGGSPAAIFRISSRSSFVPIFTLVSDCASSAHSRCVKFTT